MRLNKKLMIIVKRFVILLFEFGQLQIHHEISLRILNVRATYCLCSCISIEMKMTKQLRKYFIFFYKANFIDFIMIYKCKNVGTL